MSAFSASAAAAVVVIVAYSEGDGEENDRVQRRDVSTESGGAPEVARGWRSLVQFCLKPEETKRTKK